MTAFDTDVITLILNGSEYYVKKAERISPAELSLPVPVFEEVIRGRLNAIRQAESGRVKMTVAAAYEMLRETAENLRRYGLLPFDAQGETLTADWTKQRIKVGTMDMRIGASCIIGNATLVSRNRRDFDRLPGLRVEYWDHAAKPAADPANGKETE
jgi:tRNA(fMet)-specific endonuclease VapC